jgi:hypothetical protein
MGDTADTAAATTLANVCDHQTEGKQSRQCGLKQRLLFLLLLLLHFSFVPFVSFTQVLFAALCYLYLYVVLFLL